MDENIERVREALAVVVPNMLNDFTLDDMHKLLKEEYSSVEALRSATREGLRTAGLSLAKVDCIVTAQGTFYYDC